MKIDKILIIVCVFIIGIVFVNSTFTGFTSLGVGETSEIEGKIVEVVSIGQGFVKIKIGDDKISIKEFNEKEIKGVKIKINKVFYVDEVENRFVEIELESSYVCGDGVCDETEDKISCCNDCGCDSGFDCIDNKCKSPIKLDECWQASDCDDNDDETTDLCIGIPKKCVNKIIIECETNLDCDDKNNSTSDKCVGGECFNKKNNGEENLEQPLDTETIEKQSINLKKKKSFLSKILERLFGWI